jgi:hypothetical protein
MRRLPVSAGEGSPSAEEWDRTTLAACVSTFIAMRQPQLLHGTGHPIGFAIPVCMPQGDAPAQAATPASAFQTPQRGAAAAPADVLSGVSVWLDAELDALAERLDERVFRLALSACWTAVVTAIEDLLLVQAGDWRPLTPQARRMGWASAADR